ncbi:MAG: NAD-dependent epimerase/dehydratase family protein, partial [Alphaproteobacteria bacterium]|nr:NAD-dependent epimerase/dehydratase family protein [Alphaproteobacteria bacterium]
ERMCRHFSEDFGLVTRVARYHNVYGPHGTFEGGREKAPAAICRKVIEALRSGVHEIEIWGDGKQTRSFMYIDDCIAGTRMIYNLAADMGGMGFIETHKAECMLTVLINTHLLMAAHQYGVERYFYSSSACVYAADKQTDANVTALKEEDAYPAMPEDGYGWEKLFSERMCRHFREDYALQTRMARYHNVYGPNGTFDGGREKAPAAMCRKVIEAKLSGRHEIEIWGDGEQTRSFMYVDDCTYGSVRLMNSDVIEPINIGSDELVSINTLVDIVEKIAGIKLKRRYNLDAPKGVRGRNSDNDMIKRVLGWAPSVRLEDGMEKTYRWIHDQMVSGGMSKANGAPRFAAAS